MTTARQAINDSFGMIGVRATGQTLSDAHLTTGLRFFNMLLDSWSNDEFVIFEETEENFDLTASQASYSIGEDGSPDFDTARPLSLLNGWFTRLDGGSDDYPVEIISLAQYRDLSDKTQTGRPYQVAYNPTYPNGTLYFYYTPETSNRNIYMRSLKPISSVSALGSTLSFPEGYELAIVSNLALLLASQYGKPITQILAGIAKVSKDNISNTNSDRVEPVMLEVAELNRNTIARGF